MRESAAAIASHNSPIAALSTQPGTRKHEFFQAVARLGIEAAEALEAAHQMEVVHRDVEPMEFRLRKPFTVPSGGGATEARKQLAGSR